MAEREIDVNPRRSFSQSLHRDPASRPRGPFFSDPFAKRCKAPSSTLSIFPELLDLEPDLHR